MNFLTMMISEKLRGQFSIFFISLTLILWRCLIAILRAFRRHFEGITGVFRVNLDSAFQTVCIPYWAASNFVWQRRFDSYLSAERIRQLKGVPANTPLERRHEIAARKEAHARMESFQRSREGLLFFREHLVKTLISQAEDQSFRTAAQELLRNTLVTLWGTIEAFFSDTVRTLVNQRPHLASELLSNESTKKHFPSKGISIEALASRSFNVVNSLGDVMLQDRHMDSLPMLKDIAGVLFPHAADLRKALATKEMWVFWQQTHLIVHKRGVVDESYRERSGDKIEIGARLIVKGNQISTAFHRTRDVGIILIQALKNLPAAA